MSLMGEPTSSPPRRTSPRPRISLTDAGTIMMVHLPILAANLPAARERLLELRESDAVLAPIIDSVMEVYRLITT